MSSTSAAGSGLLNPIPGIWMILLSLLLSGLIHADPLQQGIQAWRSGQAQQAVNTWVPMAKAGDPQAMLFLGYVYRNGKGVAKDEARAFHWYRKAAEAGMPQAQYEVALMYEIGIGTPTDPVAAAGWYSRATGGEFCPRDLQAGGVLGER